MELIFNTSLVVNLILSVVNVAAYGIGYFRISRAKVEGKYILTKRAMALLFMIVTIVTVLFAVVYSTVIFDNSRTSEALYILHIALMLYNIGFNVVAALLAFIVESNRQ